MKKKRALTEKSPRTFFSLKKKKKNSGYGYGFDARSGIREPDCLPGPGDPSRAVAGTLRDPATATWTLRFDREFVVRCVPLIAPSPSSEKEEKGAEENKGGGGGGGKTCCASSPLSSAAATFTSAPGPDALGYVIRESARAGKIDAELAVSMGVTRGPMMAELKAGRAVTVTVPPSSPQEEPKTRVIRPEEVVSPERPGRVVAILGDPLPPRSDAETLLPPSPLLRTAGRGGGDGGEEEAGGKESGPEEVEEEEEEEEQAAALAALSAVIGEASGADLVVAGASSAAAAAKVADRAGASALVLTRFGKGDPGEEEGEDEDENEKPLQRKKRYANEDLAAEAEAVLAAREAAPRLSAKVAAARDLDMLVLSRRGA